MAAMTTMTAMIMGHKQVRCKHGNKEKQQATVAAQTQCRGKKQEQQWHGAANEHPEHMVVFHV